MAAKWVQEGMKLMRAAALAGVAKKVYDEARKPHNQARIRAATDRLRDRRRKNG